MNKKWNEKTTFEKTVTITSGISLFIWLLFEFLESKMTIPYANIIDYVAIFVICVCEAISFWNVKRSLSYVGIGGAIFIIVVAILEMLLRA